MYQLKMGSVRAAMHHSLKILSEANIYFALFELFSSYGTMPTTSFSHILYHRTFVTIGVNDFFCINDVMCIAL